MARLTSRDKHGHAYFPECFKDPCNGFGCKNEQCEYLDAVCKKLAEYEDTDLTPDQIREIDKQLYSVENSDIQLRRMKNE